jgi:DNA-binding CsgD family transcriptional regulator/tetratricopeptide (TPR) repeat protein
VQAPDTSSPQIVGRSGELAVFPPFLDSLDEGASALILEGDAGIGKTSLWAEGVELARVRGYQVLAYRAAEAEMQLPFVALGDLLATLPEDVLVLLPAPQRRALDVAMLRAEPEGTPIERRAVSLALVGALQRLAAPTPIVLALDDLQWMDAPSAAALEFALRRLRDSRLGLLATRRGRIAMNTLADALPAERVLQVEVPALDAESLGRLLLERLGLPLARPALLQVYRVSGGNPFLALEIVRALQRRDVAVVPGQPFPVPQSLRELVRDRLEQLPPSARGTGVVVAALGQPTVDRLTAAVGSDAVDEAVRAGLVELADSRVRFTHPLIGSIIYSEASSAERRTLHRRLAEQTDDVEERAVHVALAANGPDRDVAAALDVAASSALRRGAPETAAELYQHAAELTPDGDDVPRYRRIIEGGEAHLRAGDGGAAQRAFESAVGAGVDSPARAHALTRLAKMVVREWDPRSLAAALETYDRAAREAGDQVELMRDIEHDLAWLGLFSGDRLSAAAHARRALELAERLGDAEAIAVELSTSALMEGRGGNEEAVRLLDRALRLAEHVRRRPFAERPHFVHALFLAGDGELDRARDIVLDEYRRAVERGDEDSLPVLLECLTIIERRAGNWDDAERYARDTWESAERGRFAPEYHAGPYGWILALRGRIDEARAAAERGLARADAVGAGRALFGGHRAVLGLVALSTGDDAGCADLLEPLSTALTPGISETGWFRFLADELEARLGLGDIHRARLLVERLAERRDVFLDRAWARAATYRCGALVSAADGDEHAADEEFTLALREHERLGDPFELGRTLLARGRSQRRFKRRRASRESLEAARDLFARVGAPLWTAKAENELHRIGGRAPRGIGLTPTEERVARLAAEGLTNREIASALFLSPNTVQAYLKRVYRELGIRSRTELAREFASRARSNSTDSGVSDPVA